MREPFHGLMIVLADPNFETMKRLRL